MTTRKTYKQPASDQETLVTSIRTYVHAFQQQLEDLRVATTDDVATLRRAQLLVGGEDQPTQKTLDATARKRSSKSHHDKQKLQRKITALNRAIEIIEENPGIVRPNQFRSRLAILECMDLSSEPVSSKQIIEYLSLCGFLMDRRRLSIRLSYMKRDGVAANPKHGRWTITPAGRKEMLDRQAD